MSVEDENVINMRKLLEKKGENGENYLMKNINNPEIVETLIKFGVDLDIRDYSGSTALHLACRIDNNEKVINLFMDSDANFDAINDSLDLPLHDLMNKNVELETLYLMIKKTSNINATNVHSVTPLFVACKNKKYKYCELLLEAGAKWLPVDKIPEFMKQKKVQELFYKFIDKKSINKLDNCFELELRLVNLDKD